MPARHLYITKVHDTQQRKHPVSDSRAPTNMSQMDKQTSMISSTDSSRLLSKASTVQVFEQASLPSVHPSQQDQRAYRLSLMTRALHVLKLANVNMEPLIATQGQLVGERISGSTFQRSRLRCCRRSSHVWCFCSSVHVLALLRMLQKQLGITLMAQNQCLSACQCPKTH